MFLDDELFQICKKSKKYNQDLQELYISLLDKCDNHIKSQVKDDMPKATVKAIIDRTFRHWDSFVQKLKNGGDSYLQFLSTIFAEHTFKKVYLSDENIKKVYDSLS